MVAGTPLWLRSAMRRRATTVSLVLAVGLTLVTAVSGPLLLRAVEQSGLRDAVAGAGLDADILLTFRSDRVDDRAQLIARVRTIADAAAPPGVFGAPATTAQSADAVRWQAPGRPAPVQGTTTLVARDAGCADLTLTTGRCPGEAGDVLVGGALLTSGRLRLGERISVRAPGQARATACTVVGAYDPVRSDRLLEEITDDAGVTRPGGDSPFLVTRDALDRFAAPLTVAVRSAPVGSRLDLDAVPAARASVTLVQQQVIAANAGSVSFASGLPVVLDQVAAGGRAARALMFVTTAMGVALALASAVGMMTLIARTRTPEWALGRLRGLRRRSWLWTILAEPLMVTAVGSVAGSLAGWAWCRAVVGWIVPGGVRVEFWRPPVLATAAVAGLGLLAASVVAGAPGARAPLATLLREAADAPRVRRLTVAAESAVVALALAACAQLALQRALTGTAGLVALTAPGLLAAASALIAIRLGAAAIRRRARVLTPSVPALLVTRSLARTPSALQRYVPVAVGVALLVFATQVAWLSVRNQRLHADAAVGAATVLRVELPPGADLRSVVRAADPGGTAAMAVRERAADNDGGTSRVVAVDAGRLAAVSAWRPAWAGLDGPRLAALLRPATEAPAEVRGSRLTVAVPVASIVPDPSTAAATDVPAAADLILVVAAGNAYGGPWQRIDLGPLGYRRRTLTADVPCAAGCRLVRLEIQKSAPTPFDADLTIDAMSTDQQPASHFAALLRDRRRWRPVLGVPEPGQPPQTTVRASTAGLHVTAVSFPGDTNPPAVAPADFPDPLPAVVARDAQAQAAPGYPGTVRGVGLDGQPLLLDVVAGAAVIPRALADGVLVDLGNAAALSDPAQEQVVSEVWLAPGADPAVRRRLTAAGVRVVGRETVSDSARHLAQATPGRAAVADLAVAGAALVLLLVVLTAGRVIDVGRRRTLWSVGRLSGLPRRRLARIAAIEISGPGAAATAIGVLAGLSSAALAGGRLPLFAEGTVGPPLDVRPAWTVAAAVAAGVAAAIGLVALGCAAVEAARAADAETR